MREGTRGSAAAVALAFLFTVLFSPMQAHAATDRIIVVGDSISQGSSGDYTWRYRLWSGITQSGAGGVSMVGPRTDLFDNVRSTSGSQHYAVSFGQKAHAATWGSTFADELPRVTGRVTSASATVAIVQLGTNDMSYSLTPSQTVAAAEKMVSHLRAGNSRIKIVIGEVPNTYNPFTGSYGLVNEGASYASGVRSMAARLTTATSPITVASTRSGWDAKTHTYDGTHPNPSGEAVLANAYLRSLASLSVIPKAPTLSTSLSWNVQGPAPTLAPATESLKVSWNRVSTGSSAMYIRYRWDGLSEWQELPYPVGDPQGDAWTLKPIAGGGDYEVQLKPNKYLMTGKYGGSTTKFVPGVKPGAAQNVRVSPHSGSDGNGLSASWSAGASASGYYLRYGYAYHPSATVSWTDLPYPVADTKWTIKGLKNGHYTRVGVQSIRGFERGPVAYSSPGRVPGVAAGAVQVSIGDSFISGTGVPPYYDSACQRSANAWPSLVFTEWTGSGGNFACGGSTMDQMIAPAGGGKHTGQLDKLTSTIKSTSAPSRVLVSIGGNDMKFTDKLKSCVFGNCGSTQETKWNAEVDGLQPEINRTLAKVRAAAPYSDIYILGYPSIVTQNVDPSPHLVCQGLKGEGPMINRVTARLNAALQKGASQASIWSNTSATQSTFKGREWCNSGHIDGDWLNYPTVDDWSAEPQTAHPNGAGTFQQALVATNYLIQRSG